MRAPGEQETTFTRLGDKLLRGEAAAGAAIEDNVIFFVNADTNLVCEAAQRWRGAITRSEKQGDSEAEMVARRAHSYLCLTLMDRRSLPHTELAALIETMQTPTSSGGIPVIVISPNVWRNTITTVEELIDYAAARMSAAL